MTRLEELTLKSIDGDLTAAEDRELQQLLDADPAAWEEFRRQMDVEVCLRNLDEKFDVSEAVMAAIQPPAPAKPRPALTDTRVDRWFWRLALPAAAACAVIVGIAVQRGAPFQDPSRVDLSANVEVYGGGVRRIINHDSRLQPTNHLIVPAGNGGTITYGDRTSIKMTSGTQMIFEPTFKSPEAASKRLELLAGTVEAEVTKQSPNGPLIVKTPHAFAIVRGTKFKLTSDSNRTRLEVTHGRVDLRQVSDGSTVSVGKDMFAVAGPGGSFEAKPMRAKNDLVVYYTFQEGKGTEIKDRSGSGKPLNLVIAGGKTDSGGWRGTGGYRFTKAPAHWESTASAEKIAAACRQSGAITLEAWIEPADETQKGPARIVSLSSGNNAVNFLLGHGDENSTDEFVARLRTTRTKDNALPQLETPAKAVTKSLSHVVYTRHPGGRGVLYVNGKASVTENRDGDLSNWNGKLKLSLGNDPGEKERFWNGTYRLVAVYSRALSESEVKRNYQSGAAQWVE